MISKVVLPRRVAIWMNHKITFEQHCLVYVNRILNQQCWLRNPMNSVGHFSCRILYQTVFFIFYDIFCIFKLYIIIHLKSMKSKFLTDIFLWWWWQNLPPYKYWVSVLAGNYNPNPICPISFSFPPLLLCLQLQPAILLLDHMPKYKCTNEIAYSPMDKTYFKSLGALTAPGDFYLMGIYESQYRICSSLNYYV